MSASKDTTANKDKRLLDPGVRHRRIHSNTVSGDRPPAINTAFTQSAIAPLRRNSEGSPRLPAPPINISAPSPVTPISDDSSIDLSLHHFPSISSRTLTHSHTNMTMSHDPSRSSHTHLPSRPTSPVPTPVAPPEKSTSFPTHQSTVSRLKNKISRSRGSSLSQADAPEGYGADKSLPPIVSSTSTLPPPPPPPHQNNKSSRKDVRRPADDAHDSGHGSDVPTIEGGIASVYNGERASAKRNQDFHALFRSVPEDDPLIEDFGCALQKEILLQGRIYISENHLCFNANIFGWVTNLVIAFSDIVEIEKRATAIFIPNAIQVSTLHAKNFFASFLSRDQAFDLMDEVWRHSRPSLDRPERLLKSPYMEQDVDDSCEDSGSDSDDSSIGSYTDTESDDVSSIADLPQPHASNQARERQSSLVSLPIPRDLRGSDQEARRRAISEAGPRPNVQAFQKKNTMTTSASTSTPSAPGNEPGKPATAQTREKTVCECEKSGGHFPNVVFDKTYATTIQKLYDLLYTGDVMQKFLVAEKNTDVVIGPWREGEGDIQWIRDSTYTKPLNSPIGPKSTKCILREEITHVDMADYVTQVTTTQTPDVPSGGSFCVKTRVCLTWAGKGKVRMLVTVLVDFAKSSWLKAAIEKGSIDGQVAFYKDFDAVIRQHISEHAQDGGRKKNDKRRKKHKKKQRSEKKTPDAEASARGWRRVVESSRTAVTEAFQWLARNVSMPNTAQLTMVCILSLVIVNIFIAQKMTEVDRQLTLLFNEMRTPETRASGPSRLANRQGPWMGGLKNHDEKSSEDVWEWLGRIDPEHQPRTTVVTVPPTQEELDDDLSTDDPYRASQLAKDKLDEHMADLELMIQRAGANIDQVTQVVERQRQRIMEGWSS